ncbi:MAG TPA: HDIG domain-containing protein [Blastocatellia bacterium]|nr:HDIG domain-containing protein [Blastocatellia bacterium]
MSKPATSRSNKTAKSGKRLKSFLWGLSDRTVLDASIGIVIVIVLSLLLLRSYKRPQIDPLPAGSIATTDILAPENIKIEDAAETKRLRDEAVALEKPVFDHNRKTTRETLRSLHEMFNIGREALQQQRENPPGPSLEQLRARIKDPPSEIILDPESLAVLVKHWFEERLESAMADRLAAVMERGVVDKRSQLSRFSATGIVIRDQRNPDGTPILDVSAIYDRGSARDALRSDKFSELAGYSQKERRLIGDILASLVDHNLEYNEAETERRRAERRNNITPKMMSVEKGQPIVLAGKQVTELQSAMLKEAAARHPIGQRAIEFAGTFVIVLLMMFVLWQYLARYQNIHLRVRRHFLLQVICFAITLGLARLFFTLAAAMSNWSETAPFNSQLGYKYLMPFAVGAVLITLLTDAHAAFIFSAILAVFVGVLSDNVYLAAYTLMSSAGAIYHTQSCRDRTALVRAGLWIGAVNAATALSLDLLGANEPKVWLILFDTFSGFVSGSLATMVASLLLPLFEWLFEITTSIKLLELSNLNLPLLKQLAERAPGTYHHSIMVGLLAEAGAEAIGADALFARVACYYHDIGKTVRPTYFIENQTYGGNRHDRLSPKMSSIVLANHVKQGIEIARQHKLPPRIIAIIPQHHGTGLMKYFYYKARSSSESTKPDALEQEFRYPGPKPQTKEAAIIMIADSVEAAARTVQEPTPAKLRNMIDMIITRIQDDGQLDECNITLRELKIVADSFVKALMGIHHHRITYPGYDFNRAGAPAMLDQTGPAADVDARVAAAGAAVPTASEVKQESAD